MSDLTDEARYWLNADNSERGLDDFQRALVAAVRGVAYALLAVEARLAANAPPYDDEGRSR